MIAIAEELDDDDVADAALAYANDSIAEFQQLSPEHFAQYEADLGKAVLAKVAALSQSGMDPLRLTSAQRQWVAAEVEEAAALLRNLPETPENAAVLADVSAFRGLHLLWSSDVEAAAEALTEAGERFAVNGGVTEEADDGLGMMHVLVELLAGRQPYDWLTSMSDAELAELDLDALPLPQQAMLAVFEDIGEGLDTLSGMLAAADRMDVAVGFAHQSIALARFELRIDDDTDPEERNETLLRLGSALAQLSAYQLGTPEAAMRSAREAVDVIAPVAANDPRCRWSAAWPNWPWRARRSPSTSMPTSSDSRRERRPNWSGRCPRSTRTARSAAGRAWRRCKPRRRPSWRTRTSPSIGRPRQSATPRWRGPPSNSCRRRTPWSPRYWPPTSSRDRANLPAGSTTLPWPRSIASSRVTRLRI